MRDKAKVIVQTDHPDGGEDVVHEAEEDRELIWVVDEAGLHVEETGTANGEVAFYATGCYRSVSYARKA